MPRLLLVGDPHAVVEELDECRALIGLIDHTANAYDVSQIVFLGDQHHNHALVHVEVMRFWYEAFERLAKRCDVSALVGNHDQPGHDEGAHSMMAYRGIAGLQVVDSPTDLGDGVLAVPYTSDPAAFLAKCQGNSPVLICHQTFQDCLFENGMPCKEGVDSNLLPQKVVFSGHIHKRQSFGKVRYVGAPRWRSQTDAAEPERYLEVVDINYNQVTDVALIPTSSAVSRVVYLEDNVAAPLVISDYGNNLDRLRVDIRGPEAFVNERVPAWEARGARVRTFRLNAKVAAVRESQGVDAAFRQFATAYRPRHGTSPARLSEMVQERFRVHA